MVDITAAFGREVRRARLLRGLSQEDLAEASDLHRTYIGGIERGERNITLRNAQKVAAALGVDLSQLLKVVDTHDT
jgi:transcriptional regulator with XRE-family HTH domain